MKTRYIPTSNGVPYKQYKPEIGDYPENMFAAYVSGPVSNPCNSEIQYFAIFYVGRQSKPLWYYRFKTLDEVKAKINGAVSNLMAIEDSKQKRKVERNAPHSLKVGDILSASWGYDQTNIDFYQVLELAGAHTIKLREIAGKVDHSSEGGCDYVVAVKDAFLSPRGEFDHTGEILTKRVSSTNSVKIESYKFASKWSGRPEYQTALGWGH